MLYIKIKYRLWKKLFLPFSVPCTAILPHFPHPVRQKNGSWLYCIACAIISEGKGLGDRNWDEIRVFTYYIKLDFQGFRICPIMPQSQFIYKTCYIYETHKMVKSLTPHKSAHFFSGKKPDPEIPGKIRMLNSGFLGFGFEKGHHQQRIYGVISKFFWNFEEFWCF